MCLGALVHAGLPLAYLTEQLGRLGIGQEYHLRSELVHRNGQQATKIHVELIGETAAVSTSTQDTIHAAVVSDVSKHTIFSTQHSHSEHSHDEHSHTERSPTEVALHPHQAHPHHDHPARHLPEIEQLILAANLPERVTHWSLAIFRRLAEAEGAVHGIAPEQVHFHEVGATDAIVDIVGTCIGLDWLGVEHLYCAALPIGGGTVWAAHGRLPVPPPAVLKLWEMRQVPLYSNGINKELVTPTGAAIVTTLASQFGPPPPMTLQKVGLGAGSQDLPIPNILRLWIGTTEETLLGRKTVDRQQPQTSQTVLPSSNHQEIDSQEMLQETVSVLETQIDDLNPQAIGYVMQELLSAGALDVFTQAIGMKKNRPGILLTVICRPEQVMHCEAILFQETTTLGIRRSEQPRSVLQRSIEAIHMAYGQVRIKVARNSQQQILNVQPEYEDCAHLAQQHQIPWREVHRLALQSWYQQFEQSFTRQPKLGN
jgi:pyridinium-3,5-bisthiocarboxylic acid mononucleotide nickel chelatase